VSEENQWERACKLLRRASVVYLNNGLDLDDCPDTPEIDNIRHYVYGLVQEGYNDEDIIKSAVYDLKATFGEPDNGKMMLDL